MSSVGGEPHFFFLTRKNRLNNKDQALQWDFWSLSCASWELWAERLWADHSPAAPATDMNAKTPQLVMGETAFKALVFRLNKHCCCECGNCAVWIPQFGDLSCFEFAHGVLSSMVMRDFTDSEQVVRGCKCSFSPYCGRYNAEQIIELALKLLLKISMKPWLHRPRESSWMIGLQIELQWLQKYKIVRQRILKSAQMHVDAFPGELPPIKWLLRNH